MARVRVCSAELASMLNDRLSTLTLALSLEGEGIGEQGGA